MSVSRPIMDMTVELAAEKGTRLDLLYALRRRLAAAFDDKRTQPRDLSPLTMRLRELAAEIQAIEDGPSVEPTSDLPFDPDAV